jgi:hypothetical protein
VASFDRVVVGPDRAGLGQALCDAAAAANARPGLRALPWPPADLDAVLARLDGQAEGLARWAPGPPVRRPRAAALVACAWWRDYLGRAHVRVRGWFGKPSAWPPRPPLLMVRPERVLLRGRGPRAEAFCLCPCGAWGAARSLGWMGDRCGPCFDRGAQAPTAMQAGWPTTPGAVQGSLAPDGRALAVLGPSGRADGWLAVAVHDAATGAPRGAFTLEAGRALGLWLGPEGAALAARHYHNTLHVELFDPRSGRRLGALPGEMYDLAFAPFGGLASLGPEGLGWHDARGGRRVGDFEASAGRVAWAGLATDGRRLAAPVARPPSVGIWDVATRSQRAAIGLPGRPLSPPAFDAAGRLFCLAGGDLIDEGGSVVGPSGWPPTERAVTFAVAAHGAVLARGPLTLRVWRPDGASPSFDGDAEGLLACGWLPDGRLLTLSRDHGVNLWPAALFRA